jgi:hypothetical protein
MYVTEIPDKGGADALQELRRAQAIEFAEPEPPRHLP